MLSESQKTDLRETVGFLATVLSIVGPLIQLIKTFGEHGMKTVGLSSLSVWITLFACLMWVAYGVLLIFWSENHARGISLVTTYFITAVLEVVLLVIFYKQVAFLKKRRKKRA